MFVSSGLVTRALNFFHMVKFMCPVRYSYVNSDCRQIGLSNGITQF